MDRVRQRVVSVRNMSCSLPRLPFGDNLDNGDGRNGEAVEDGVEANRRPEAPLPFVNVADEAGESEEHDDDLDVGPSLREGAVAKGKD